MNGEIIKILSYFNLTESEAKTYLACLKVGKGTAYEVAKLTNLKKPTVYVHMESLADKGLVTTQQQSGRTHYIPVSPRQIVKTWKGRVEALEAIQPDLNVYYRQSSYQPKVQVFEGQNGVDAVYNELPPLESKGDEVLLFGSVNALRAGFDYLIPRWERAFKNKKNPMRELLYSESGIEDYIEKRRQFENQNYQMRMLEGQSFGKTDNIIWQNKIAIFSLDKELFVTIIESEEIVKTYIALFDAAWDSARVIK